MFALLLLATVSSEYIAGCNQVSCDARSTNVAGLPAPSTPPALLFSLPGAPHPTSVSTPGCLSNLRTIFCATYASQDSTTWTGGSILNSTGSLLFSATNSSSLRWCLQDSSFSAQGAQLGIMSTAGDLVAWSPSCIARMSSTGLTAWQSPLSPASPCSSLSTGISSIGLASPSTLTFYRESGQIFSFYPSGTPDASLSLRANSSSSNSSASALPSASGFLLPLALTTDGAQRTLYLTRFYKCSDSHNAACTGLPSAAPSQQQQLDPTPTLLPTAEIRLVAMDSRTGTPTDPRRMELPWANLGPRIAGQPLDACALPSGRELLHAAATVLPGGSTLVAAFACLQDSLTGAPGPLFLAAFDVHGNASEPRPLWSTSTGSLAAQPGGQPPAMVQHPSAPQLLYIAGAGAGSSGAQVVTVNASSGQVLAVAGLAEAVRQAAAGAACPLSLLLLQQEEGSSYVLQLTAPPKALPPPAPSLLLSVTATTPGTGANATAWLVALALEEAAPQGAALLPVRWCVALPEGGFQGQFVAATADLGSGSSSGSGSGSGSAPQPEDTVLVGVAASGAISGFSWPAAAG